MNAKSFKSPRLNCYGARSQTKGIHSRFRRASGVAYLSLSVGLFALTPWAAELPLGEIGKTQLQQDTGDSVNRTCLGLLAAQIVSPLSKTCDSMVFNALELEEQGSSPNDEVSRDLDADTLADSLQHVATEEFANTESMATEVTNNRFNTVITRLSEVRRGVRGFSVSGLSPDNDQVLADASRWYNTGAGERGGGAGDEESWGNLGVYLNGSYGTGDRDATRRVNEFDFDTYGLTLGADYQFTDNLVFGAALSYFDIETDFDNKATVNGGSVNADGWGGTLYGTYYGENYYIDGLAGYAQSDYEIRRKIFIPSNNPDVPTIVETAKADPDSDDYTLSLGGGYDFNQGALAYGPYARLTYLKVDMDDYKEKGAEASGLNLKVDGQDWKSLTSVLGAQVAYSLSQNFGVLVPQARLGWVHEFKNPSEQITAVYIDDPNNFKLSARTDKPDRDHFELGIGVSAVFKDGLQAFVNYDTILGFSNLTDHRFTLGGRWEF